jgi:hypothetical protein
MSFSLQALCWAVAITAVAAAAVHASGVYTVHTIVVHCISKGKKLSTPTDQR